MYHDEHVPGLNLLVELLDQVVREQVGDSLAETMNRIRRMALERRAGVPDAEQRLLDEIGRIPPTQLRSVIRWLSLYFDLANLAEDYHRVRILDARAEAAEAEGLPRSESIADAIFQLVDSGCSAAEMQEWLDRLAITPVFTAHPSEAKRRTTRELLRRLRDHLPQLEDEPRDEDFESALSDLTLLWQTDSLRPQRPGVMGEVERGLFFAEALWDVAPQIYREMRLALARYYPHHQFELKPFLTFGSWIGGDRDGHPFVTAKVTETTLGLLRKTALERHLSYCRELKKTLVTSDRQAAVSDDVRARLNEAAEGWEGLRERLEEVSPNEVYRSYLKMIEFRLEASLGQTFVEGDEHVAYQRPDQLMEDVELLCESMLEHQGSRVVHRYLDPWKDRIQTFGFHFFSLDVRQDSDVHRAALREILFPEVAADQEIDEKDFAAKLTDLKQLPTVDESKLSDMTREVLATFGVLADTMSQRGTRPFGGYVISMTHQATDVLAVLWLWNFVWQQRHPKLPRPHLPIAPLFETIDDLERAPKIFEAMLDQPVYRDYLSKQPRLEQMIMVGYSDSTKDGGYLTASWNLHSAQERLAEVAAKHHIEMTIFHGRGGSLGRGGGPAARGIQSLPPQAVDGKLRLTEQGEVLAERYDNAVIAHRHIEQLTHATLLVSAATASSEMENWKEMTDAMSKAALAKYRELVSHDDFLRYFDQATPISEIEGLPIGSRPARRRERKSLKDLRAIPWTFAWTQSRQLLPAWYGMGTGIRTLVDEMGGDWEPLQEMYLEWPVFQATIDNAELALAKADMEIARDYAELAGTAADSIWRLIDEEFRLTCGTICLIRQQHELLEKISWLNRSIRSRNPYVDPLNLIQIQLIKQSRESGANADETDSDGLPQMVRLTIQGIAAGLRSTG
ncbi:phosphoenolpyruvate carboxylase [Blastopirellula marina]|uniref:Phosphoenolpyruvate carboxylase n=1 Tax=Blastopirellula marina TaxID=124 RepID=A0A2S8GMA6_9BACT|nr:phosphoenolpyruvate carboxylase [Blastopirellula marina]PQO45560.1 phosphoenolpyruvate carboxylase [Blastopirellula marina]